MEKLEKKKNFDYKWVIIALCFLTVFVTLGFCSSTQQYFIEPVTEHLNILRTSFSIITFVRYVVVSIVNFFFGSLIVKFGPKKLIFAGFLSLAISMLIFTFAGNIFIFYIGAAFLGLGFAWTGTSMIGYVVNIWSKENRGTIMGAILCANGLGGAIAMRIVSKIINSQIHNPSYKAAYFIISIILIVSGLLILILFKDKPKNFEGEMEKPAKKKGRGQVWTGIEFSETKKKPYFYLILVCVFLAGLSITGVNTISKPHMSGAGLDINYIDLVMSLHSIALAGFKFLTGFIYDKCGLRITSAICSVTGVVVMLCFAFISNTTTGMILAMTYGIFSSLTLPLETIMLPIYANDLFGEKSFGKVVGLLSTACCAGIAIGSPLTNICFDLLGSYQLSLIICAILMALSIIILQFVIKSANKVKKQIELDESLKIESKNN